MLAETMREGENPSTILNALSVDLEDWFHLEGVRSLQDRSLWPRLPSIVERETDRLLEALAELQVRATFFTLGWVAERYPEVVRRVAAAGHEIGSHSYWHYRVDRMTPAEFRADLETSVKRLEDLTGQKVLGFRAPAFSITPGAEWALDVLREVGLKYDASMFPAPWGHGGYPVEPVPQWFRGTPSGEPILELPLTPLRLRATAIPFSGGGYFRLLPLAVIHRGFRQYHREGRPVVVYLHPRDYAENCPQAEMPFYQRFRCFAGIRGTWEKVLAVLQTYRFDTCAAVLGLAARSDGVTSPPLVTGISRR